MPTAVQEMYFRSLGVELNNRRGQEPSSRMRCPRNVKKWLRSRRPAFRYLTEEEYQEQADAATARALEELRQACRRPDFPSWLAVSRLQAPRK